MDWIFDNFQILALVGLAFASWLKHRFDAKMAEREEREARNNRPQEEEEYLGPEENWNNPYEPAQPYVPPPLPQTPQGPPPLPSSEQPLRHSREGEAAAVLQRQQDMQERFRKIKEARATTSGGAAATRARLATSRTGAVPVVSTPPSIRTALKNPSELRRAIVMKEILSPPVSLR
ncbi:MAG: hypothetical protein MUF13_15335 [Akkermansiaceae bacterium]|jgi:hypothetical protein|nr:hypothetical protein [Akkermansiaceae bacterium]